MMHLKNANLLLLQIIKKFNPIYTMRNRFWFTYCFKTY
jgi:hypothetical protein